MEIAFFALVLMVLALLLAFPFLATRSLLQATARSFADPRRAEAAQAVRRAARLCLGFWVVTGALTSLWCYHNSVTYQQSGAWLDFGAELWFAGCFVPIWPVLQVLIANSMPVRVQLPGGQPEPGFSRFR